MDKSQPAVIGLAFHVLLSRRNEVQSHLWGIITMAITKKSLISNSPASHSKSKSSPKVAGPTTAAKLATANRLNTASGIRTASGIKTASALKTASGLKTTMRASRATYAKLTTARIVS
jgi:hypothetical protein